MVCANGGLINNPVGGRGVLGGWVGGCKAFIYQVPPPKKNPTNPPQSSTVQINSAPKTSTKSAPPQPEKGLLLFIHRIHKSYSPGVVAHRCLLIDL